MFYLLLNRTLSANALDFPLLTRTRCSFNLSDACRTLEFMLPLDGNALVNHVIRNITLERQDACRVACYLDNDCLSYNFGRLQDGNYICQLSDSDHVQHPQDLKKNHVFIYRGTEVIILCRSFRSIVLIIGIHNSILFQYCFYHFSYLRHTGIQS